MDGKSDPASPSSKPASVRQRVHIRVGYAGKGQPGPQLAQRCDLLVSMLTEVDAGVIEPRKVGDGALTSSWSRDSPIIPSQWRGGSLSSSGSIGVQRSSSRTARWRTEWIPLWSCRRSAFPWLFFLSAASLIASWQTRRLMIAVFGENPRAAQLGQRGYYVRPPRLGRRSTARRPGRPRRPCRAVDVVKVARAMAGGPAEGDIQSMEKG